MDDEARCTLERAGTQRDLHLSGVVLQRREQPGGLVRLTHHGDGAASLSQAEAEPRSVFRERGIHEVAFVGSILAPLAVLGQWGSVGFVVGAGGKQREVLVDEGDYRGFLCRQKGGAEGHKKNCGKGFLE